MTNMGAASNICGKLGEVIRMMVFCKFELLGIVASLW